jgi:asparagine synthase (glutamine-hydrolysing)
MCGISGLYNFSRRVGELGAQTSIVQQMTDRIVHRGPDADGVWADDTGRCTLGHRRLSIIDTSDAGRQPMHWREGEWSIVFNGEIYNFLELKRELEALGVTFHGRTDTEVLLAGLAVWGEQIFSKLDGMFAFAAFHRASGRLILARDPFGEKPLYYFRTDEGGIAFASELQCLEHVPGFSPLVSADALAELLMFQYIGAPRTIYQHVHKLEPGHYLIANGPDVVIERYFQVQPGNNGFSTVSRADLADELESILVRSLERRLIADVPLGAFLSGGVDSSTVCALARRKLGVPLQTFSIGFQDDQGSEHEIARQLAAHLGTEHRDQIVSPSAFDFLDHIDSLLDEPNGDSSCLPTYMLSQFAKQHVTVALSGDGGDEVFGGYGRYFDTLAEAEREASFPSSNWSAGRAYYCSNRIAIFNPIQLGQLFGFMSEGASLHLKHLLQSVDQPGRELLHRLRVTDIENYMPGAVLPKVDRMSMQHSMEVRTPFLNVELARFAEKLPAEYLVEKGKGKLILRDIAYRYLPREIMDMPKKGFGLPLTPGWGKEPLLGALKKALSPEGVLGGWIGRERVEGFVKNQAGDGFSIYQAWSVIMLANWLNRRPVIMPDRSSFESISLQEVSQHFGPAKRTRYRMTGLIAPNVLVVSSLDAKLPDSTRRIDAQLSKRDMVTLLQMKQQLPVDLKFEAAKFDAVTYLLPEGKDIYHALKEANLALEGVTLLSLDSDAEWIRLLDVQLLRTAHIAALLAPKRFSEEREWIWYAFRYPSKTQRLASYARLLPHALQFWKNSECERGGPGVYTTKAFTPLATPTDRECALQFAVFEGPSQWVPFVSSHEEIKVAGERRYSVWNSRVHYAAADGARGLWADKLFAFNWIVPVNAQTAAHIPVFAKSVSLKKSDESYLAALRNLVDLGNKTDILLTEANSFVLYTQSLAAGGAERQWCNLAAGLKSLGKKVYLVVGNLDGPNGHYLELARKSGIDVLQAGLENDADVLNATVDPQFYPLVDSEGFPPGDDVAKLASILARLKPDVLLAQLDWTNITAAVACLLVGTKRIVLSFRNYNPTHFEYLNIPWFLPVYREVIAAERVVLTGNSKLGNADYAKWLGLDAGKVHLLPNSYLADGDHSMNPAQAATLRRELNVAPDQKIVLGAFRLSREKNPELFFRVCTQVLNAHPHAVVLLCGEGPLRPTLVRLVDEAGLSGRFKLLGRRADVWKLLAISDVLLLTSDLEGTPNIVREALEAGCPVVSTACGAVPEMVRDGVTGFLAEVGDMQSLVEGVERIISDPSFQERLAQNLLQADEVFTARDQAESVLSILKDARD